MGRQRSWGAITIAVVTLAVGGFAASAGGSRVLATETSVPSTVTATSTPSSSEPDTSTSTSTTTTLPLAGQVGQLAERQDPQTWVTAMPTFPPPPTTTTTTLPPDPCANPALPANSGSGRRAVYSKQCQRVWLVEEDGTVAKTHAVSGRRTWNQPTPNNPANEFEPAMRYYDYDSAPSFYRVMSRSAHTCNINKPYLCWRYMVRFTVGPEGDNIGFHEIPVDTRTGRRVQNEAELGRALSSGCVRQATPDAQYLWDWAWKYTKVVVLG